MVLALEQKLRQQIQLGKSLEVDHATLSDLAGFEPARNACHANVDRWCEVHPTHRRVRGWLITGGVLDKHSVVDRGAARLLDITPMPDQATRRFLPHDGDAAEFDALPHQVTLWD